MLNIPLISQQSIPLEGLLKLYEERLVQAGYCICYRYDMLHWAENFISIHLRNGYDYMNQNTINQFIKEKDEQRYKGEIGQEHYRKWKRIIERFVLFAYTGEIGMLPNVNIGPTQELSTQLSHKQFPAIRNTYNEKQEEKRKIDIQAGKQFAETTLIKSGRKRL